MILGTLSRSSESTEFDTFATGNRNQNVPQILFDQRPRRIAGSWHRPRYTTLVRARHRDCAGQVTCNTHSNLPNTTAGGAPEHSSRQALTSAQDST